MENEKFITIMLEKLKFALVKDVGKSIIDNLKLDVIDVDPDYYALKIKGFIWGYEERRDSIVVNFDIPLNWWQMFRESHFPKFLLKKWPIKKKKISKEVDVKTYGIFPKNNLVLENRLGPTNFIYQIQ